MKVVVLKPMAWNRTGYIRPEGIEKSGKDFVAMHGFGGEEWNGDETRIWNGMRVFYTNATDLLRKYGKYGELGIIMTAYDRGTAYALGVATSVQPNSKKEIAQIAEALKVGDEARRIWQLPSVKKRNPNWKAFERKWNREWRFNVPWRCPSSEYFWFEHPIRLDPSKLFPPTAEGGKSPAIIKMYGTFQAIRPDQALAIVRNALPLGSPIVKWLSQGKFDSSAVSQKTKRSPKPSSSTGRSPASAAEAYTRYIKDNECRIPPKHTELQNRFRKFIKSQGAKSITEYIQCVDIQFRMKELGLVLGETKPCTEKDVRFAIRTAMGQLLDYRQRHPRAPVKLLVIVEATPSPEDIELALSNGFGLAYPKGSGFAIAFPT